MQLLEIKWDLTPSSTNGGKSTREARPLEVGRHTQINMEAGWEAGCAREYQGEDVGKPGPTDRLNLLGRGLIPG